MQFRRLGVLMLGIWLALGLAGRVSAQTETGRITGVVTDSQGGVVPGAAVTATSRGSGAARTTITDREGRYVIANVLPGVYDIKVELAGFKTAAIATTIPVGGAITYDAKLEVGGVTESVTISAPPPQVVNLSNAEIATVVTQEQIRDLPTLTRNPYDLVSLAGNVQEQPKEQVDNGSGRGNASDTGGYNINGARASDSNILLDGAANNNEFDTTLGQSVPLDAVQEFSVVTNNYSAQYGRASGGIINVVTKSGTNQFRGTGYEFFRNDFWAAKSPETVANRLEQDQFTRHQMGYSLGGPIVKNKAQFFSSLEYIRVRSNSTELSWVPTAQFLAASDAATRAYFAAYAKGGAINGPTLNRSQVSAIIGSGAGAFNNLPADLPIFGQVQKTLPIDGGGGDPQDNYQTVNRVDYSVGPATQAYVRYAYARRTTMPGTQSSSPYDGWDTGVLSRDHNVLASLTHVFGNSFTSQTKVVWNRIYEEQPVNGPSVPRLMMNATGPVRLSGVRIAFPGYLPWQPGNDIPFGGPQSLVQLYQDHTWLRGAHDVRFGGSYVHIADNRTFSAYSNAVEALNTTSNALTSLNNFVTGNILRFQAAINPQGYPGGTYTTPVQQPSFTSYNRYNEFAFYVQDNWAIASRVKVNLGLRYEYFGPQQKSEPKYDSNFYYGDSNLDIATASPSAIINALRTGSIMPTNTSPIGSLWRPDKNNFAPRVGFAWDATGDGRTAVRGGYGIGYSRNFGNVTFNTLFNPPDYLVSTIDAPSDVASQPIYVSNLGPFAGVAGITKAIPAGSVRHVDQNIKTAYTHMYGLSIQRELARGLFAGIDYNGSTGRNLYDLADINKRGAPLVYQGAGACTPACTADTRPNTAYAAFNTRGNRGQSQYHGVTLSLDSRKIDSLQLTARYTISQAKDNLSSTFSDGNNGFFNLGYLDAFDPMLDYGYAEHDVRHRISLSAIYNLPFFKNASGGVAKTILGDWMINPLFTARTGYPFSIYDCTNALSVCMRAIDPVGISRNATGSTATGNPNEYTLLDLAPIMGAAGTYVNPITGNSDFGPYPSTMTKRDDFRGPGAWYLDMALLKRFKLGNHYAAQLRFEVYNVFNHANMFVRSENADVSSFSTITGYKDGFRRAQLGFKLEF